MAQFTFKASFVSRSKGQSTIAKAAYNSREALTDWRTGEKTKNYEADHGPAEWSGIFAPKDAPEWMRDREQLWNRVEAKEDDHNRWQSAQPSRTFIIAIPAEFDTAEKRQRFVIDYGREQARRGWVSDMAIHAPDNDQRNYHLHVQSPLREILEDGFGKRIRLADKEKGITREDELEMQKKTFCNLAARHLERYGHTEEAARFKVAYMTLEKQREEAIKRGDKAYAKQLDRDPTVHLGPAAWAMDKEGKRTRKGDMNREIKERNRARAKVLDRMPENLTGSVKEIWIACQISRDAADFWKNLEDKNLALARVSKEDAEISRKEKKLAPEGEYRSEYREGEYVVLNERGLIYRLTPRSTGKEFPAIMKFMETLDKENVPGMEQSRAQIRDRLMRQSKHDNRREHVGSRREPLPRGVTRAIERSAAKVLDVPGQLLEGLLAPRLTPEQKLDGEVAQEQRRLDAERTARRRQNDLRER